MAQPWLRLYTEILHDPKVQRLSDGEFRFWISCLCAAKETSGILPNSADLAWILRTKPSLVVMRLNSLVDVGLLDVLDNTQLKMHGWDERQYESDTSAARMRRFRERHRDGDSDVTVTSPVTPPEQIQKQNRTDTEKKEPSAPKKAAPKVAEEDPRFTAFYETFWYPKDRRDARKAFESEIRSDAVYRLMIAQVEIERSEELQSDPRYRTRPGKWLRKRTWEEPLLAIPARVNGRHPPVISKQDEAMQRFTKIMIDKGVIPHA